MVLRGKHTGTNTKHSTFHRFPFLVLRSFFSREEGIGSADSRGSSSFYQRTTRDVRYLRDHL